MRYFWLCALGVLGSVPAMAQPPKPDLTAMYEDVEVMRRLLGDAVVRARPSAQWVGVSYLTTPQYFDPLDFYAARRGVNLPSVGSNVFNPRASLNAVYDRAITLDLAYPQSNTAFFSTIQGMERTAPATDGTYLKGVGVVLNVTMDLAEVSALETPIKSAALIATCARCHGTAMNAKVQPPAVGSKRAPADPWDVTLRQVRGEKELPAEDPPAARLGHDEVCLPGVLTELVVTTAAEYGHRFRELPSNEALTVVVTLKGSPRAAETPANDAASQARSQAEEQIALADLHSKQGKTEDAISAYQKAVEAFAKPLRFPADTPYDQAAKSIEEATKVFRAAHGKLAQALLAAGKFDEAKAAIEAAKSAGVRVEGLDREKALTPLKPALPIKLTVRTTKQSLDAYKAGKMTPGELRSAAEVDAVGFPKPMASKPKP